MNSVQTTCTTFENHGTISNMLETIWEKLQDLPDMSRIHKKNPHYNRFCSMKDINQTRHVTLKQRMHCCPNFKDFS